MRFPLLLVALAALTAAGARAGHAAPTGQPVEFRNGDVTMKGMLFKPDGDGPFFETPIQGPLPEDLNFIP